jgi:hypothetical protein
VTEKPSVVHRICNTRWYQQLIWAVIVLIALVEPFGVSVTSSALVAKSLVLGKTTNQCSSSHLRVLAAERVSEPAQQLSRLIVLINNGREQCELIGYPRVTLYDKLGRPLQLADRDHGDQFVVTSAEPSRVLLAPAGRAYVMINETECGTPAVDVATTLAIIPPADSRALHIPIGRHPTLESCAAGSHVTLDVSPIEPTSEATRPSHP